MKRDHCCFATRRIPDYCMENRLLFLTALQNPMLHRSYSQNTTRHFPFKRLFPWLLLLLFFVTHGYAAPNRDSKQAADNTSHQQEWPLYGQNYANQRFSRLSEIHTGNVQNLKLAWGYHTGKKATFQSSPIVSNGIMYITTPFNDVIALDALSGKELWRYRHQLRHKKTCCGPANRGPALADGMVFTTTIDARLIALDQKSGRVLWDIDIEDTAAQQSQGESIAQIKGVDKFTGAKQVGTTGYSATMAPQVYDGKVFAGITGTGYGLHLETGDHGKPVLSVVGFAENGAGLRGFLAAYDGKTGKELWRWYSVPEQGWEGHWQTTAANGYSLNRNIPEEQLALKKHQNAWRFGGGSIWSTPAIDPDLGLIYLGTGNPSPQFEDSSRPGDNLYTCSLVALDIETGELKWFYQQTPHDRWGYDVASPPVLFDYHKGGEIVRAVGQASKSGWFFIHDAATGDLLTRSEPFIQQENMFAPPSESGQHVTPGPTGAISWSPVAIDPESNAVFIPGIHQPADYYSVKVDPDPDKPWSSYSYFLISDEPNWGILSALSLKSGEILWQTRVASPLVGGVLATAGQLIFSGEGQGQFSAYHTLTGQPLWHYQTDYGVNAPPITYAINGKQYIAVAAGGNSLFGYRTGDALLVFTLPD